MPMNKWLTATMSRNATTAGLLSHIAVGDAVGEPLEFSSSAMASRFEASISREKLEVSDDTQMAMFLADALWSGGSDDPSAILLRVIQGYKDWYTTQTTRAPQPGVGGLLQYPELFDVRAPGHTCMTSCAELHKGLHTKNNSKGNGTVMRCAPIALFGASRGWSLGQVMDFAALDAAVTHGHPLAAASSRLVAALCYYLLEGRPIQWAVEHSYTVALQGQHPEALVEILSVSDHVHYMDVRGCMGGWVAEEAVVLAVGCLYHSTGYVDAIRNAATIHGDSDSVAAITGALAYCAGRRAPAHLLSAINVKKPILFIHDKSN